LKQQIVSVSSDEIKLKGNMVIGVHTNNFRTVRGRTLLAVIADEVCYWRDELSANPDVEVYRACKPALRLDRDLDGLQKERVATRPVA
jgi:hypothetical protein